MAFVVSGTLVQSAAASTATVNWTAGATNLGTNGGVRIIDGGDGALTTPVDTGLGVTGNRANVSGTAPNTSALLYFDVVAWTASVDNARVEVQYWDEAAMAGTRFRLQWRDNSFGIATSGVNYAVGTGGIGTAVFYISSVQGFTGQQFNGADFRILVQEGTRKDLAVTKVIVTGTNSATPSNSATSVSFDFGQSPIESGLLVKPIASASGSGFPVTITEFGRKSLTVDSAGGMFIDVDDGYMFENTTQDVTIDITFYDKGFGFFYMVYDGLPAGSGADQNKLKNSFGPDQDYQANNIVYMSNSGQWLTHRFNLYRPHFGNYLLNGRVDPTAQGIGADFKIIQPQGTDATNNYVLANQNYLLHISSIVLTKSSDSVDVKGTFRGTYAGAGEMAWIWTRLASLNEGGHGLLQDESAKATTAVTGIGGKDARRATSGEIYFNINDNYVKNALDANSIPVVTSIIAVEYFDGPTGGTWSLQYDGTNGVSTAGTVTLTGTSTWLRKPFTITDGKYGNGLNGNDFRIVSPTNDLNVRDVMFTRPFGPYRTGTIPEGFSKTKRVVGTHYFPVFDGNRPTLWEASTAAPSGTGADNFLGDSKANVMANSAYSNRSTTTHTKELTDMRDSGVDFAIVYFHGSTSSLPTDSSFAVTQLAASAVALSNGPKLAVMIDEEYVQSETHLRNAATGTAYRSDLSDDGTRGLMARQAEDFYSLVPRSQWMTIAGRPLVFVYFQAGGTKTVAPTDATRVAVMKTISDRFFATHGVRPYIIPDRLWDPNATLSLQAEEYFSWAPGYCCADTPYTAGFAQANAFSVGPGFADTADVLAGRDVARSRDRENGEFYKRGWARAIAKGNHMVIVDTWNYFAEGTSVAETREFGRAYLTYTATNAAAFKAANYATGSSLCTGSLTVCVTLGSTNTNAGIMQDDLSGATTTGLASGGRKAVGASMLFAIDDSFLASVTGGEAVTIAIDYVDSGVDFFDVKYDATGSSTKFAGRQNIGDSNTGQTRTAAFKVGDGFFGNRDTGANDLRIDSNKAGALVIKAIRISKSSSQPVPTIPSGWKRTFIGVSPTNVGGW